MSMRRTFAVILTAAALAGGACIAQDRSLADDWNDFLHYTLIGRLDVAKAYAQAIIEGDPDPVELLALCKENPRGHQLLVRAKENKHDPELARLSRQLWDIIERGTLLERSDASLIYDEVKRLSTTTRGYLIAVKRLKRSGEYAIPFMLDALADRERRAEWPNIVKALPEIARPAIRPLVAALQNTQAEIKAEIIKALGKIGYPQSLAYLKYVVENDKSAQLKSLAGQSIRDINPAALNASAAELFYRLAEEYYYHAESLAPAADAEFANIWFWDAQQQRLTRERVDKGYFNELMAMRCCEWALKADEQFGRAIGMWVAAFFKAESANVEPPQYFGPSHADAMTYATTAGPQYLHQALARAVKDNNAYVAVGVIEALAVTAGEKSLFYRLGTAQPLVEALSFDDQAVKYSAAIAIAAAGPRDTFPQRSLVVENLTEALANGLRPAEQETAQWNAQLAHSYAIRALRAMLYLAQTRNPVIDLSAARTTLIRATHVDKPDIQTLAGQALAYFDSPDAQRAIAAMALDQANPMDVRLAGFDSLAVSAKLNASLLDNQSIDAIYTLVGSQQADPQLRSAAAAAYGALNLPSQRAKDLILDQAQS